MVPAQFTTHSGGPRTTPSVLPRTNGATPPSSFSSPSTPYSSSYMCGHAPPHSPLPSATPSSVCGGGRSVDVNMRPPCTITRTQTQTTRWIALNPSLRSSVQYNPSTNNAPEQQQQQTSEPSSTSAPSFSVLPQPHPHHLHVRPTVHYNNTQQNQPQQQQQQRGVCRPREESEEQQQQQQENDPRRKRRRLCLITRTDIHRSIVFSSPTSYSTTTTISTVSTLSALPPGEDFPPTLPPHLIPTPLHPTQHVPPHVSHSQVPPTSNPAHYMPQGHPFEPPPSFQQQWQQHQLQHQQALPRNVEEMLTGISNNINLNQNPTFSDHSSRSSYPVVTSVQQEREEEEEEEEEYSVVQRSE